MCDRDLIRSTSPLGSVIAQDTSADAPVLYGTVHMPIGWWAWDFSRSRGCPDYSD